MIVYVFTTEVKDARHSGATQRMGQQIPNSAVTNSHRLALILFIGVLAMSSASLFIRWADSEGAPVLVIAAYRLTTATLVLSVPAMRQHIWRDYVRLKRTEVITLLVSGALLACHFAAWIASLSHTTVMASVVLVSTTPLWAGLASALLAGERTSRGTWVGMLAAVIGATLIGLVDLDQAGSSTSIWGNLLALSGAVFMAGYLVIGRGVRRSLSLFAYIWVVYAIAAVILILLAIASRLPLTGYSQRAVLWMVALGLIPQLIGHSAANYAVRQLPAPLVGTTILGEPIGSTLLAMLLLDETVGFLQLAGGILILAGISVASFTEGLRRES